MKKWYYVIVERGLHRTHRHPSLDKETAEKWALFYDLEAELKALDQHAWADSVELDEDDDIGAFLCDADEDYCQCCMDGYFDY